ncbi:hypothetical protein CULT_370040 [[Clostridium] ultunense Esp]|nr:hypothetical protein CULT_370040 [[Clostridium] ultunense Esp]
MNSKELLEKIQCDLSDEGTAVGIKIEQKFSPSEFGGEVQPPSYLSEEVDNRGNAKPIQLFAIRRIKGREALTVQLDSIPSQANRLEEFMEKNAIELNLPVMGTIVENVFLTQYRAPHRSYDAYFKFSELNGTPFFESEIGKSIIHADSWSATPLYKFSPNIPLFGGWASHADDRALNIPGTDGRARHAQAKFERAVEGSVIGVITYLDNLDFNLKGNYSNVIEELRKIFTVGKTASRFDPFNPDSTGGKLSDVGLGHIPPTIDYGNGYVTVEDIFYQGIIKFPSLRKLYFPSEETNTYDEKRDVAARVVLAALSLYLFTAYLSQGAIKLRSRATLEPNFATLKFTYTTSYNQNEEFELNKDTAKQLYFLALEEAKKHNLRFNEECLILKFNRDALIQNSKGKDKISYVFNLPNMPSYMYRICPKLKDILEGKQG